ncbi:MAG: hypothetical protein ACI4MB_00765 [Candidatus Coproplasma sp.]
MKSLVEKYNYNSKLDTGFSHGYCTGVRYYRNHGNCSTAEKQKRNAFIDDMKVAALKGHSYAKGFMCAIRDCANERKGKKQ